MHFKKMQLVVRAETGIRELCGSAATHADLPHFQPCLYYRTTGHESRAKAGVKTAKLKQLVTFQQTYKGFNVVTQCISMCL